ncbi:MFS transporter, partial [Aliivibrio fischeri]
MLDRFDFILFKIVIIAGSRLFDFTNSWGWLLSFFAGVGLPTFYFDKLKTQQEETTTRRLILASSVILFFIGTLSNVIVPSLLEWAQRSRLSTIIKVHYSWTAYLLWPCFFIGIVSHVAVRRTLSPLKNKVKTTLTKQSDLVREERTDVRNIRQFLPDTLEYDPLDHIDLEKGMFVGLDRNQQPQYIPMEDWQKQHADILGTTGAGKGVASGMLLYQSIMAGEGVFVLDPKNDEWAPHLFKFACEKASKPFYLIDLNQKEYQLDLFAGINRDQIEELLVAGFSLAEKGDMADFYRIDDRKAARESPLHASDEEIRSIETLFNTEHVKSLEGNVKAFYGKMEELSLVQS